MYTITYNYLDPKDQKTKSFINQTADLRTALNTIFFAAIHNIMQISNLTISHKS